ncbi:MAG: hypothetical protein J6X87_02630 [Clostridia bacterium]|nr:hypothetical protein [Clostridia bacterium]
MENTVKGKIESKDEQEEFKFLYEDIGSMWPRDGLYYGYTKREASDRAKEIIMSVRDKIYKPWFNKRPWLDEDVVMDIVPPAGAERFIRLANRGGLRTEEGCAGYDWRITN